MISLGLYRAKYEKKKFVNVTKVSNKKVWFEWDNKRFVYDKQKFIDDFIR
jgi:hypothetical protein